jgi:serine/threonine protein kinase
MITRVRSQRSGKILELDPARILGRGGEATIYAVPSLNAAAKVYHLPSPERTRKLEIMLANPPSVPASSNRVVFAWPIDILLKVQEEGPGGAALGFLMPRVSNMRSIVDVYHPRTRKLHCPGFTYLYLHRAARNLAVAIAAAHARGYVIGDVNESNVLVEDTALVTLVDTDSFQVFGGGVAFRCPVGKPEFTPPELQAKSFADVNRTVEHDRFGLAVLIFHLLMEGTHPFAGIHPGGGDPPTLDARIADGSFPYAPTSQPVSPPPLAPPIEILDPEIRRLTIRCFVNGHTDPAERPTATEWQEALDRAATALKTCSKNPRHSYGAHLSNCPWCARTLLLGGLDPFPAHNPRPAPKPSPKPKPVEPDFTKVIVPPPNPGGRAGRKFPVWALAWGIIALLRLIPDMGPSTAPPPVSAWKPPATAAPGEYPPGSPGAARNAALGKPVVIVNPELSLTLPGRASYVPISLGEFWMGCSESDKECDKSESPQRRVRIAQPFQIGKYEVTQAEWARVMDTGVTISDLPQMASWNETREFFRRLNTRDDGYHYRLPTEAEWEYAARAGTQGPYTLDGDTRPGPTQLDPRGWYLGNSQQKIHPVGKKLPNAWGLYDMEGNVWEWVEDPPGVAGSAPSAPNQVVRGGSAQVSAKFARVSSRQTFPPNYRHDDIGFRAVRVRTR